MMTCFIAINFFKALNLLICNFFWIFTFCGPHPTVLILVTPKSIYLGLLKKLGLTEKKQQNPPCWAFRNVFQPWCQLTSVWYSDQITRKGWAAQKKRCLICAANRTLYEVTYTAGSFKCSKLGTTFATDLQKNASYTTDRLTTHSSAILYVSTLCLKKTSPFLYLL